MAQLLVNKAEAYVNYGRWVAECPTGCGSAFALEANQAMAHCTECGNVCPIVWPVQAQEIWDELQKRPMPRTRNWFPKNHDLALQSGCPHGQSVHQLIIETMEHEAEGTPVFWSQLNDEEGREVV
jgi:hypothetical protein